MSYDPENIFAKILRGDIPCNKIYDDDFAIAFHDINPQTEVHLLVIPKGAYVSMADFSANALPEEITGFMRAVGKVAEEAGVAESGYRIIANAGPNSHQEVPHLHFHILGGKPVGPLLDSQFRK